MHPGCPGFPVTPDHIHLLISQSEKCDPSRVKQAIKQGFSRRVKSVRKRRVAAHQELFPGGWEHVWQRRFYDWEEGPVRINP